MKKHLHMNSLKGQAEKKPNTRHSSAADVDISNRNLGLSLLSCIIKVSNFLTYMKHIVNHFSSKSAS